MRGHQRRIISSITVDEMKFTNPCTLSGVTLEFVWKRSTVGPSNLPRLLGPKCPLTAQSGHRSAVSSAGAKGCPRAVLRLHLLVSVDKEVVEIVNANKPKPRIFHVCQSVERDR